MSKIKEIKEKAKTKVKETGEKVKHKLKSGVEFTGKVLEDNPQYILPLMTLIGGLVGGAISGVKLVGDNTVTNNCVVEDDVTELEFHTKRPLTNSEILELGERMIDGQTKGDALNEMGLLKKEKKRR